MDVMTAIKGRRSIREFKAQEIEPGKVETLKEALIWAPSAGNLQSRLFYFVYSKDVKKRLVRAALGQDFISAAPLVIVGCADLHIGSHYGERGIGQYCIEDLACSIENMMLAATSLGLGSVWVGAFHEDEVARTLKLPEHLRPMAIVPVGYPDEKPEPPERVSLHKAVVEVK
jgi:nitroreductase